MIIEEFSSTLTLANQKILSAYLTWTIMKFRYDPTLALAVVTEAKNRAQVLPQLEIGIISISD